MKVLRTTLAAAFLVLVAGAPTVQAQPVVNEKALPKGTTAAQAIASLEAARKKMKSLDDERAATFAKANDAAGAYLAPMRKKAEDLAKSDKAYRAFLDTQKSTFSAQKGDPVTLLREHYAKNRDLFDRVYKLSGGDPSKDGAFLTKVFANYNPTVQRLKDSILAFAARQIAASLPPPGAPVTLAPPYAIQDAGTQKLCAGISDASASASPACRFDLHAFAVEGVCTCSALGFASVYVQMPANTTTMEISVSYDAHYKLTAAASIFSGGYTRASMAILVQDVTSNAVMHSTVAPIDDVLAFMFLAEKDLPAAGAFNTSASLTAGKQYLITFRPAVFAESVNASWAEGNLSSTPTSFNCSFR